MTIQQLSSNWCICNRADLMVSTDVRVVWGRQGNVVWGADGQLTWENNPRPVFDPVSISFQCKRKASCIEQNVYEVFLNVIAGKSTYGMQPNPNGCSHDRVTGGCGNIRGSLAECRCDTLDRLKNPSKRNEYENQVISKCLEIIKSQNQGCFHLKLAMFCSGGLLGEEILLFRLFDQLRRINASGTLELFLIDLCYSEAIRSSLIYHQKVSNHTSASLQDILGQRKDLEQFLLEICQCVQPAVTVKGTVFHSADSYINRANQNQDFKHHLLVGADIEDALADMAKIDDKAGLATASPIALVKIGEVAQLCQVDMSGNLSNCYVLDKDDTQQNPVVTQKNGTSCVIS